MDGEKLKIDPADIEIDMNCFLDPGFYDEYVEQLRRKFSTETRGTIRILPAIEKPLKYILIDYQFGDEKEKLRVFYHQHVIYVAAYLALDGWWEFKKPKRLIMGSHLLSFDENYNSMGLKVGSLVGPFCFTNSIRQLHKVSNDPNVDKEVHVMTLCLMGPEAARNNAVFDLSKAAFTNCADKPLDEKAVVLIRAWGTLSQHYVNCTYVGDVSVCSQPLWRQANVRQFDTIKDMLRLITFETNREHLENSSKQVGQNQLNVGECAKILKHE